LKKRSDAREVLLREMHTTMKRLREIRGLAACGLGKVFSQSPSLRALAKGNQVRAIGGIVKWGHV
jgi:hypothetical protein